MNKAPATKSILQCIEEGARLFDEAELFFGHGTDNPLDEALWLVFYQLNIPWDSSDSILQEQVSKEDESNIFLLFERRIKERIPAAYITGEAWFSGYAFIVSSDVLVPRSPIAELILSHFSPWLDIEKKTLNILDLCTGSGCIGIASALQLPHSQIILSDISPEALSIAQQNIRRYNLDDRVKALESDCFEAFDADSVEHQFDLIISNPPYVDAKDFNSMPSEYLAEPELGLVSGDDGLDFTRRLLSQAADYLSPKGCLIVEVGNSYVALEEAFPALPFVWLEFENGGDGVFVLSKDDLIKHRALLV